jgi:hypothetical protein
MGNDKAIDFGYLVWKGIPERQIPGFIRNICNNQRYSVHTLSTHNWRMSFRWWLDENIQDTNLDVCVTFCLHSNPTMKKTWQFGSGLVGGEIPEFYS